MHHFQNNSPYKRSATWGRINGETIFGNWIKHKNFTFGHVASLTGASIRSVKYWAHGQALPSDCTQRMAGSAVGIGGAGIGGGGIRIGAAAGCTIIGTPTAGA